jgi:hypothetical protein
MPLFDAVETSFENPAGNALTAIFANDLLLERNCGAWTEANRTVGTPCSCNLDSKGWGTHRDLGRMGRRPWRSKAEWQCARPAATTREQRGGRGGRIAPARDYRRGLIPQSTGYIRSACAGGKALDFVLFFEKASLATGGGAQAGADGLHSSGKRSAIFGGEPHSSRFLYAYGP